MVLSMRTRFSVQVSSVRGSTYVERAEDSSELLEEKNLLEEEENLLRFRTKKNQKLMERTLRQKEDSKQRATAQKKN